MRLALQRFWEASGGPGGRRWLADLLLGLPALFYGTVQRLRRGLYRRGLLRCRRVGTPVISVGGLRVGGSGKTPFVLWLARRLSEEGLEVAILTRGYGRRRKGPILLEASALEGWNPLDCGDEPFLLARRLPGVRIVVDADRVRGARLAQVEFSPDVFVLDDGFQHLRLARDLDIVLFPEGRDAGRLACLPRGPLREPLSALSDAHVAIRVRGEGGGERGGAGWVEAIRGRGRPVLDARLVPEGLRWLEDGTPVGLETLEGRRVMAFCGIAREDSFWETLAGMGITVAWRRGYPDHARYTERDYRELASVLRDYDMAVTTEKDAVKIEGFPWPAGKVCFVRVDLQLEGEELLWDSMEALGLVGRGGVS